MQLQVTMTATATTVVMPDETTLVFSPTAPAPAANGVRVNVRGGHVVGFGDEAFDECVLITVPWGRELAYVERGLQGQPIPEAQAPYLAVLRRVLARFGVRLAPAAKRPAKARHRFDPALRAVPFAVDHNGAKAVVYWPARDALTIQAGATLAMTPLVTKTGALKVGTKFGEKLRADHAAAIEAGVTTADVTLRSVNEVGLFLYYGDTNGWQVLVNPEGETLDALTKVE